MATLEQVTYDIVDVDKTTATIFVRYKTEVLPEGLVYPIDLPIDNGAVPSGDALQQLIMHNAPVGQLAVAEEIYVAEQNRKALVSAVDLTHIDALIVPITGGGQTVTLPSSTL
jgi:hypothetical protein